MAGATPQNPLLDRLQMFRFPLGMDFASAAPDVAAKPLNAGLLEDPSIVSSQLGTVVWTIGGLPCNVSNQPAHTLAFHPEAYLEGHRSFSVPITKETAVRCTGTLAAAGTFGASVGFQPIPDEAVESWGGRVPDVSTLGKAVEAYFGLGSVAVPAGGTATLTATALSSALLGALVLDGSLAAALYDVTVVSITVRSKPQQAAELDTVGAAAEEPLGVYSYLATDLDGRVLGQHVEQGHTVDIVLKNRNAAPITVYGTIFLLPPEQ